MTSTVTYRILKTRPFGSEDDSPLRWILIRTGTVDNGIGYQDFLPETDVAIFTSEKEANLFAAHLRALESKAGL
jgi:hypothetical protein